MKRISAVFIATGLLFVGPTIVSAQRKATGETTLVGIRLFDTAYRLLDVYGNPDEIQGVGGGGGGIVDGQEEPKKKKRKMKTQNTSRSTFLFSFLSYFSPFLFFYFLQLTSPPANLQPKPTKTNPKLFAPNCLIELD